MEFLNYWKRLLEYVDPFNWLRRLWELLQDAFYWIAQAFVDLLTSVIGSVTFPSMTLPELPAHGFSSQVLGAINWIVPLGFMVDCFAIMVFSTVTYFTVGVLLRWLKVAA